MFIHWKVTLSRQHRNTIKAVDGAAVCALIAKSGRRAQLCAAAGSEGEGQRFSPPSRPSSPRALLCGVAGAPRAPRPRRPRGPARPAGTGGRGGWKSRGRRSGRHKGSRSGEERGRWAAVTLVCPTAAPELQTPCESGRGCLSFVNEPLKDLHIS